MAKLIMLRHKVNIFSLSSLFANSPIQKRFRRVHANVDPRRSHANHEISHSSNPLARARPGFVLEEILDINITKLQASSII